MGDSELLERVNELLIYDADTGVFVWRVGRRGVRTGSIAGCIKDRGYRQIMIDGKLYLAHRLVWLVARGMMPRENIDHINGVTSDNRITNLREANHSENARNRGATIKNTSGFKGVSWHKGLQKWAAKIVLHGESTHLGHFSSPELAYTAYCAAAGKLHGEFVRY